MAAPTVSGLRRAAATAFTRPSTTMDISIPLSSLLERVAPIRSAGEADRERITGVASLIDAVEGDLSFIASARFIDQLAATQATVVLIEEGIDAAPRSGQLFLWVRKASLQLAGVCEDIARSLWPRPPAGIHPMAAVDAAASVDPSASIGPFVTIEAGAVIGPNCVVGSGCVIRADCALGEGCWLSGNVTLERDTVLGKRVRIHAGAVLGADGFGYEFAQGRHQKIPQIGRVLIGDDVDIGANTTIDRGRFGPTTIGEGSKIDNQVQVGHNVVMGKHCIVCAQTGLSGSTTIGDYVVMGGRSGSTGHQKIGSAAQIAGGSVVYGDLDAKGKYGGAPAIPLIAHQRILVLTQRLPDLFKRLSRLESQLAATAQD